ncbi:thioredoxin [Clostridium sp. CAG:594]|jgi:thioredoxin 1|nr:thioredoxin [Clostridium sp. CAG:594]
MEHITSNNFDEKIKKDRVLVDFYATWCGPCKMLGLVLEKFDDENIVPILKLDVDEAKDVAEKYKVFTIPTLIIFENGKEIKRKVGYQSLDELRKWVNDEE